MAKSAQRQWLVKVSRIDGWFMTKSGGNISADSSKVYDGGNPRPFVLAGPAEADNVTVSRAYDPDTDAGLLRRLRPHVGRMVTTITCQQTNRDLSPVGTATVYSDALLVGISEPEFDASSGDAATFELEFAIGSFT